MPGRLGYSLLRGGDEGMTPAELRALPIVIHERHHHQHSHQPHPRELEVHPNSPTFLLLLVWSCYHAHRKHPSEVPVGC